MSDDEGGEDEKAFCVEVAKQGRAVCKKCKNKCLQGEVRIAKLMANPFGVGKMKAWHHISCLFEVLLKQRATTKRIESPDDIDGWDSIPTEDQNTILEKIEDCNKEFYKKHGTKPQVKSPIKPSVSIKQKKTSNEIPSPTSKNPSHTTIPTNNSAFMGKHVKDNLFREFRKLVADITNNSAYTDKTNCVKKLFSDGCDGGGFKGDMFLWCRLLLPGVVKRVYNLQSKQLIKLFSRIFGEDQDEMLEHLKQGDIGETIQEFFEKSTNLKPLKNSVLTLKDVDQFLEKLSKLTKEDEQVELFQNLAKKCTSNDLKLVIRLIKGDLRMGAGAKHVLDGIHPDAYAAYQASRDLETVISKCMNKEFNADKNKKNVQAEIRIMTPVLPMLAEACKSVEQAMKKCPNGMYSEIKYDGERVQVHKSGLEFKYFSRSLKPVMPHKIQHFKEYIPQAFPHAKDLILDSEILMIDTNTGKPLPFGTLGKHKKVEFRDANVCLFVFDCIYYNGESLVQKPLNYRKRILQENMKEIKNRIMFSEMEEIHKPQDLAKMIAKVLQLGLEGLVLKDVKSIYEPGKRHWLKVKKDYLFEGAMADTADLIVLGAWYGTGKKGGMMSVFLMGCYNPHSQRFCTVTKVHTGHDDKTLETLQNELDMEEIDQDPDKVPTWLNCTKTMIPDFVAKDPKKQPVWEITGAEFTQIHDVHTANGISIRFPRVTRIRDDKTWETATTLPELQQLYKNSKENTDVSLLMKGLDKNYDQNDDNSLVKNKKKGSNSEIIHKRKYESEDENEEAPAKKINTEVSSSNMKLKVEETESNSPVKRRSRDISSKAHTQKSEDENEYEPQEKKRKNHKTTSSNKKQVQHDSDSDSEDICIEKQEVRNIVSKSNENDLKLINPIPSYFGDVKALIEDELKKDEHSEFIRHFVAFGGTVLDSKLWREATHVFHYFNFIKEPLVKSPYKARHVSMEWVKDSIAEKKIQDFRFYTVQWDPEM